MEYAENERKRKPNSILALFIAIVALMAFQGCSPSASVTLIEGTGIECPSGSLGMVVLVKNNLETGNIGVKVSMTVENFGNLEDVDNKSAQEVTEKLVKGASIINPNKDYSEDNYFHYYNNQEFVKGSTCKITLFYFVEPEMVDENLAFSYDYDIGKKQIKINTPITKEMIEKSLKNTESTQIAIK